MNMKSICIKINDVLAYIVLGLVLITSAIVCATTGVLQGLAVGAGGLVLCSLIFGVWFCLSGMHDQAVKQTVLLEKLSKHII